MVLFSISYTNRHGQGDRWHKSAQEGSSPYVDWLRLRRPSKAAFKITNHMMDDVYTIIFDPNLNALYIDVNCEYWYMNAVALVQVDMKTRKLRITRASCRAQDEWSALNGDACPNGKGGARFMRKALKFVRDLDVLGIAAKHFFGEHWTFVTPLKRGTLTDDHIVESMHAWNDCLYYNRGPWGKTTAYFDTTEDEKSAATRIQSVFRGWQARMKYRYNPYTTLGRYVVLRDAGFI